MEMNMSCMVDAQRRKRDYARAVAWFAKARQRDRLEQTENHNKKRTGTGGLLHEETFSSAEALREEDVLLIPAY